ncbi:GT2 family glycosyltransferase [Bradyrhizobium diazoefficiens]|jgi:GT2 family glycosyltransferase|uniref:Glycosyltransferase family 2 protein n=5 Tax=Bradyrhizobium TaxID=374 RepID=A0A939S9W9_9BRAD|nr:MULTISPECIES: glycosyltransferase family 2 protein [Bradyrhizobium]MBR0866280.1 glycosyltransferase family 2 protein [Bradyrhizobium diazoefficiens]MBR0883840.1 glycosyltransferase family 2 protein [Bradyrhizobium liaoningense]MBR0890823.1 glycosyltransferase family 2 protein [Bradyrhizobium diazoefficiens]MBR0922259.1 glycosyltransferase family 2 protein [Bradyrhizobium diazoefficiens]MBR0946161.1 glycosyltransferase family 2 protein [Bradyrhizobium liaoningense]
MSRLSRQPSERTIRPKLVSRLELARDGTLSGFVYDAQEPERRYSIEILLDGLVFSTTYADAFVPELAEQAHQASCGFAITIEPDLLRAARTLEARLANLGTPVGQSVNLESEGANRADLRKTCQLRWLGGLHFQGWIDSDSALFLEAIVDGEAVAQVNATAWTHVGEAAAHRNARAFDFHAPRRFADGRVHRVSLRREDGEPIPSTAVFVAFPDGLAGMIDALGGYGAERLRGQLYDQLIPASLPFSDYVNWCDRFPLPMPRASGLSLAVVVAGAPGAEQTLAALSIQTHESWTAGVIDGELLSVDSDALLEFLDSAASDSHHVVIAMAGVVLEPNALARIAAAFDAYPEAIALYGDLDFLAEDGRLWPLAFPAFDYERMLEQGYCAHLFAVRRDALLAGLETRPDNLYRLFNCLLDHAGPREDNILHLPGALATLPNLDRTYASRLLAAASQMHLDARAVSADVTPQQVNLFPAVRIGRAIPHQRVTVVIPTRDGLPLLRTCIDSIAPAVEFCRADILVVDNDSVDPKTIAYLAGLARRGVRTLRVEGPFNFARLNNHAAATLDSDVLCLLNNDIEASSKDWLEEMLTRLAEPDVGAVGALLTWPGGVVQHGGVVLGMNFAATHAFTDRFGDDPGFLDQLLVAHECSAVTAACLATRRRDYLAVGGMDESRFAIAFNDVDYCLRLRQAGKRIVFTPHAKLVHAESASRGRDDRADRRGRFEHELNLLRARWGEWLNEDPAYNPQLSRDGIPYSGLAWPPGPRAPRYNHLESARDVPLGF